jgi:dolichyl-phosphate-mannose-protein mannosyltransferase
MDASSFQFVDSATYPDDVPYVHMRMFIATFGACLPVVAWLTAYQFGMSGAAASLVALLVLFGRHLCAP